MTREEAKDMWIERVKVSGKVQYYSIVDVIYNDFESRTCESCKYFGKSKEDDECPMEFIGDSTKEYCWKWSKHE